MRGMKLLEWLKQALLWGALSYACGYGIGMLSSAGVPEGALRGEPLQDFGLYSILAACVIVGAICRARPVVSWLVVILFELGLLAVIAYRVRFHTDSLHPYGIAVRMTAPVFAGALAGFVGGAWLGTRRAAAVRAGRLVVRQRDWLGVRRPLLSLPIALVLLAGGSGYADIPIIALVAIPLVAIGAFMIGRVAFGFGSPGAPATRRQIGTLLLVIGTVGLCIGSIAAVADIQRHVLWAERREAAITSGINPAPDARFLAGWRPDVGTLALWLLGPCLLFVGVNLREGVSKIPLLLLLFYWLAGAPLAVLVFILAYLRGEPLSA